MPGVVGPRHPEHAAAAHPLPARQDVLDRPAVGVADVQPPGHVRRRNDHDEARRARGARRAGSGRPSPSGSTSAPRSAPGRRSFPGPSPASAAESITATFGHEKRALGALSYIRRRAVSIRRPDSSSLMRCLMTISATSGITSQAISRTIRSESRSTTREASRSISSSERPALGPRNRGEHLLQLPDRRGLREHLDLRRDPAGLGGGGAGSDAARVSDIADLRRSLLGRRGAARSDRCPGRAGRRSCARAPRTRRPAESAASAPRRRAWPRPRARDAARRSRRRRTESARARAPARAAPRTARAPGAEAGAGRDGSGSSCSHRPAAARPRAGRPAAGAGSTSPGTGRRWPSPRRT